MKHKTQRKVFQSVERGKEWTMERGKKWREARNELWKEARNRLTGSMHTLHSP